MRIVFIGPPGAGKGTQAVQLIEHLKIPHLSTGDMLRQAMAEGNSIGQHASSYVQSGRLVPDAVVISIIGQRLEQPDCDRGCLFDGFPRTQGQAAALDEYLHQSGKQIDLVLALQVPENLLVERLLGRGRGDDNLATIRERFKQYEEGTKPLFDYYRESGILQTIDGTGTPDEVQARIRAATG